MKKSILIAVEQFTVGGLETHIRGEIAYFLKSGWDVHFAVGNEFVPGLLPEGVTSITHGLSFGPAASVSDALKSIHDLRRIIRERAVGVLHVHPFASVFPAVMAAQLEKTALALTLHGPASLVGYGPLYEFLIRDLIIPNVELLVAVSPEVMQLCHQGGGGENALYIPNAVDFDSILPATNAPSDESDSRWLVASRLEHQKIVGILDFIHKAKRAELSGVVVAGDGPAKDILRVKLEASGLGDYVEFLGFRSDIPSLMKRFSGVAGMGRVVLEGVACERPVVLIGYDGAKRLVDQELLARAAKNNFSGRGIEGSTDEEFIQDIERSKSLDVSRLREYAKQQFHEEIIWHQFRERLEHIVPHQKDMLQDFFDALVSYGDGNEVGSYMTSSFVVNKLSSLLSSEKYYHARLWDSFLIARQALSDGGLQYSLGQRDIQIANLTATIEQRDAQLASLKETVEQRDTQVASLKETVEQRDAQLASLKETVEQRDTQVASLKETVEQRDVHMNKLVEIIELREREVDDANQKFIEMVETNASLRIHVSFLNEKVSEYAKEHEDAILYRQDKEIYIEMLKLELEKYEKGILGTLHRGSLLVRRVSSYLSRALVLIRRDGWQRFFEVLKAKIKNRRLGGQESYPTEPRAASYNAEHSLTINTCSEPLLNGELVIITGVPFDDVGGGQRAAQLARCALKTGRSVTYLYIYKKYDFELNQHVDSNVDIFGLKHAHIGETNPSELLRGLSSQATLLVELPHALALPYLQAFNTRGMRTVFELIDDWETSLGGDWFNVDIYRSFVAEAKCVVGTAKLLVKRLVDLGRNDALYLPNAANEYIFDKYKTYERPFDLPREWNRIGLYFGSLYGEWFAWDYVEESARRNPDCQFVLIGDRPSSPRYCPDNVRFLGGKQIDELPAYLAHADFAILPFLPGKISDAVSPIKVFEYLFSGKPVVSTRLPEIDGYPGVLIADTPEAFSELCSNVLECETQEAENDQFIARNSWYSRLDRIIEQAPSTRFKKAVSVIILVRNNRNIIGRCLGSLLHHCDSYLKEVIVVDNASSDGTFDYIKENFPSVQVLRNSVNGCSSGRNLGVNQATGKYLAFFDSDQWFTSPFAFEEALSILERDANVGVIGWAAGWFDSSRTDLGGMIADYCPNRAMNESAIRIGYRADIGYLGTGGFFVPKSIFDATDGFDISYDPTCFEDTDMSFQIKKLGFDVCYRDLTGIRHQPHQTTNANSNSDEYSKLFKRNSDYFKKKWASHPEFFMDYPR